MRSSLTLVLCTTFAALGAAGAQRPAVHAAPKVAEVRRIAPPAPHTDVLADIEANDPVCHAKEPTAEDKDAGISRRIMYTVAKPARSFFVTLDQKNEVLAFSATNAWGTEQPTEREAADATFNPDGTVIKATKFLGYAGPKGTGATYPLTAADLASLRALSAEIQKRCSK